jgi:hypothetical protein
MRSIAPLAAPQMAGVIVAERTGVVVLFETEKVSVDVQFSRSVTVTIYEPEDRFDRSSVITPLDHKKVYAPAGVTERSIDPLGFRHELFAAEVPDNVKFEFRLRMVKVSEKAHPFAPVMVIE